MGGVESRFSLLLIDGSTEEALHLWVQHPELQSRLRPNEPIRSSLHRDTPLHCAARAEMKILLNDFLEAGGDPLVCNANGETPLHIVCTSARASSRTSKRRAELLQILLDKLPEVSGEESYDIIESSTRSLPGAVNPAWGASGDGWSTLGHSIAVCEGAGLQNDVSGNAVNVPLGAQDKVASSCCMHCLWGVCLPLAVCKQNKAKENIAPPLLAT